VCPYNQAPLTSSDPAWQPRPGLERPRLADLWLRSDDELQALLKGSAMRRANSRACGAILPLPLAMRRRRQRGCAMRPF
jgi:epoxyqueuosine reductase QueG